ncbi:putative rab3 GTPase-activating protein non-catalytic subunit [Penaeus vannamei]|uniref:Putative rab3 GTPase-activating protein non-catalytic subunit n=1 Tax=Penaeus vannamei TaxID=6689 RepID=A0A3R7PX48_PENVA|nr:putative rab3 GTPase-activating protein non-catalytic subunit [Penaeus vannamei]
MSCLLDQIAAIGNTTEVVQWLCPHLTPSGSQGSPSIGSTSSQLTASEWNEEWEDWGDMDPGGGPKPEGGDNSTATHSSSSPQPETSWLAECYIAASPTSDLMAVGFKNRLAILSRRWESYAEEENKMRLVVTWRGTVGYGASDEINAILCLPLLSQKQSSTGGPDWTCVIVGFTSGYVAMYTECGLVLLSQIFEEGPVLSLKCRTMTDGSRAVLSQDTSEELIILYPRSITTIDGFSLFQTLRGCRNQVAKAAASGGENVSVPPLGYKKWGLVDQGMVMDCAGPGVTPPYLYDHLAQTSLAKGFNHMVSSGVPASSLLLTVGRIPFIGFLYAQEGSAPPFVADVALLYASKLKDALVSAASGWLFGRGKNREAEKSKEKPKIEPATPLPYKWSVPDKRRTGLSLSLAPGRRLAAVTDDFGRVTLIDVQRGVALRMWKGYRDADCGWLEVEGEWGGMKRQVAFLLIYAPRRGLLEVWTPQQGPRVAAFNVPKHARLLYTPHTLLGVNSVRGVRCKVFPVLFVTPDGQISEVIVPFHMALGGKTSKRARDLHLLKTLKSHLRNNNEEEVLKTVSEIKTSGVRKQAVQALILSQHLTSSLLQGLLDIFLPVYCPDAEEEKEDGVQSQDHESRLLGQQLLRLKQLLQLYMVLVELHTSREASPDPDDETLVLVTTSKTSGSDASGNQSVPVNLEHYANSKTTNSKKVRFSDSSVNFSIGSFIRCWDVTVGSLVKDLANKTLPVNMKEDIQQEKRLRLGEFLYGWAWHSESMKKFSQAIEESGSNLESLLHVAYTIGPFAAVLTQYLKHVFLPGEKVLCDISQLSPWWSSVRDKLVASTQPYQAYIASLLCRGVHANLEARLHSTVTENALHFKKDIIQTNAEDDTDHKYLSLNDWEGLSMEMVEWNLVIGQLECLLPLNQFLSLVPENGPQRQPKLEVSVKDLLDKGKGYVAELVANWFIGSGMDHECVVQLVRKQDELRRLEKEELEKMDDDSEQTDQMEVTSDSVPNDLKQVDGKIAEFLKNVSKKFPNSVAADSVLTNMSWELVAAWNKARDDTNLISQAVKLVGSIRNSHIRHGVSLMLWETWVSQFVQLTTSLMDKVGRIPKDRLCRRDLGLGEHNLAPVLQAVLTLLEQIMEANVVCEVEKPLVIPADSFWSGQEGSPALVELTVMQKMTCYDLVYQHYQLVSVLYLVTQHGLKSVRPLTYFDGKDRSVLFKPLTTSWTIGGHTDPTVIKARLALLCRVITAAVSSLPDTTEYNQGDSLSIRQAIDLGRAWGTSLDVLHRHHICELYTSGLDKLAEEELPTISDATLLGSQLVLIAGQRLNYQLENSPRTAHHLALTSPTITEWIKSV